VRHWPLKVATLSRRETKNGKKRSAVNRTDAENSCLSAAFAAIEAVDRKPFLRLHQSPYQKIDV